MRKRWTSACCAAWLVGAIGCGRSFDSNDSLAKPARTAAQSILGGTLDRSDSSIVAILGYTNQGIFVCSGTLIAPNLVMTAHHCVADVGSGGGISCGDTFSSTWATSSFIVTSSYNAASNVFNSFTGRFPAVDNATWFGVRTINTPPGSGTACGWDLALLELSHSMNGICPTIPRIDSATRPGEGFTAIGFGITSPSGQSAGTRYSATGLTVQNGNVCGGSGSMSSTYEWCGADSAGNKGTCEGDSGGPALDSAGRVLGAVSRGPNDCTITIYSGVYGWRTWITQMAQTAAQNGGYAVAGWVNGGATSDPANGYCGADGGVVVVPDAGAPPPVDAGTTPSGCPSNLQCIDGSGQGDYGCFDPGSSNGFPTSAPACQSDNDCSTNWHCWAPFQNATSGFCIEACTPAPVDAGTTTRDAGTPARDAGTPARDAGTPPSDAGTTSTTCPQAYDCVDADGQGTYVCVDPTVANGFPVDAPQCQSDGDCNPSWSCWLAAQGASSGSCLQGCVPQASRDAGVATRDAGTGADAGRGLPWADAGAGAGVQRSTGCSTTGGDGAPGATFGSLILALALLRRRRAFRR